MVQRTKAALMPSILSFNPALHESLLPFCPQFPVSFCPSVGRAACCNRLGKQNLLRCPFQVSRDTEAHSQHLLEPRLCFFSGVLVFTLGWVRIF